MIVKTLLIQFFFNTSMARNWIRSYLLFELYFDLKLNKNVITQKINIYLNRIEINLFYNQIKVNKSKQK